MQFEIVFDENFNKDLYEDYSKFIYSQIKKEIRRKINPKKYKVREPVILQSSLIKWKGDPPRSIDLVSLVENCIEMVKIKGIYVIRLNESKRIPHSFTKVSKLIRMLEYGTNKLPAYPLVTRIINKYRSQYPNLYYEYMKERFGL